MAVEKQSFELQWQRIVLVCVVTQGHSTAKNAAQWHSAEWRGEAEAMNEKRGKETDAEELLHRKGVGNSSQPLSHK